MDLLMVKQRFVRLGRGVGISEPGPNTGTITKLSGRLSMAPVRGPPPP